MKENTNNKSKKRKHSENAEGFSEGIFDRIGKGIKKATKAIKKASKIVGDSFLKPLNKFKKSIMGPINSLEDFIRTIICLAVYLELVFKWFSETIGIITQYVIKAPICSGFWILNSFVLFLQFIIIDIILNVLFIPSSIIGNFLGYPFTSNIRIDGEVRKTLYDNTNVLILIIKAIDDNLDANFKIHKQCFEIGSIKPFPTYFRPSSSTSTSASRPSSLFAAASNPIFSKKIAQLKQRQKSMKDIRA